MDYPYLQVWLQQDCAGQQYSDYQLKLARRQHAPAKAIYQSKVDTGVWVTVDDIFDTALRAAVIAKATILARQ